MIERGKFLIGWFVATQAATENCQVENKATVDGKDICF